MIERRRYLRITEDDIITYEVLPVHRTGRGITENLSIGGIRFFADEFIPISSILKVEVRLKHADKEINAIVKVRWIKEYFDDERYNLGTEFIEISSEDIKFLNDYLYKRPR
jgi:c-di-GMP-binding flagellar brake protein YcgR